MTQTGKLGRKLTPEANRGAWWFSHYVTPQIYDTPPFYQHHAMNVKHQWWMNNELQCCTISALAKIIEQRCALVGKNCTLTNDDIVAAYSKATGYVKGDSSTDNGGQMKKALKVAMTDGIGDYKITGYVRLNTNDMVEMRAGLWFALSVYVGSDLPKRVNEQPTAWYIPTKPDERDRARSLGGHAFDMFGADHDGLRGVPWIDEVGISNAWNQFYVDEGYVIIDEMLIDYLKTNTQFDLPRFQRNLAALSFG